MPESKWLLRVVHPVKKPILLMVSSVEPPEELAKTLAHELKTPCEMFAVGELIGRFEPTNSTWLERDGA